MIDKRHVSNEIHPRTQSPAEIAFMQCIDIYLYIDMYIYRYIHIYLDI